MRGSGRPMRETFLLSISDMYRIRLICGCVKLSVGMMEGRGSMKMKIDQDRRFDFKAWPLGNPEFRPATIHAKEHT